ncbi:MAG: PAS domain S-box protein, partial [Acidobacteria bacterium]|nr:PAS domain S-box protein [Acidobacteriota bacterium]
MRSLEVEIQEAVVTVGLDRKIRSWSPSAERVFGWTAAEAAGRDVFTLISPQSTAAASDHFIERLLHTGHLSGDTLFLRKDGSQLETRSTFVLLRDADGAPHEILGIARDVSDLRRERARQLDDARLRGLAERMNESELVVGLDGQIVEANERAAQLYGFSRAELLTMNARDVRAPETLAALPEQLRSATQGPVKFQTTHLRKDGSTFPVEVSSRPFDIAGRKYMHALLRDMTGQIQRETRLREQAEQLERAAAQLNFVLEGANDGFWDWHIASGRVQYSPRWAEMLGYEQHELTDGLKAWERLLHPDDRPLVDAALNAHLRGESTHYLSEHRLRHKDGRWVWVLDRGKVVEWADD